MRIFHTIVSQGSFAAAARALDLAPAAVTRAMAELEQQLGVRLLQRSTRRMALTATGENYLLATQPVLSALEAADAMASHDSQVVRGAVRVHAPPAFCVHQLMPQLSPFSLAHPDVQLVLSASGPVAELSDTADLSLLSVSQPLVQGDFVARLLAQSSFLLCASPDYLARRGEPLEPNELLQHPGLLPAVAALRDGLHLYPVPAHRDAQAISLPTPSAALTSGNLDVLRAGCLAGLGIAGLPTFMVAYDLQAGRLRHVLPQWRGARLSIYAAAPTRKHMPQRVRLFLDFLLQTFGGLEHDPWWPTAGSGTT